VLIIRAWWIANYLQLQQAPLQADPLQLMLKGRDCCLGRKKEVLKRRNEQWEGESLTDEDFHLVLEVEQQV